MFGYLRHFASAGDRFAPPILLRRAQLLPVPKEGFSPQRVLTRDMRAPRTFRIGRTVQKVSRHGDESAPVLSPGDGLNMREHSTVLRSCLYRGYHQIYPTALVKMR